MSLHSILFRPLNKSVIVAHSSSVLDAALSADIPLEHACGACCSCATCHVIVEQGFEALEPPSEDEMERLADVGRKLTPTSRLACQIEVTHDLVVSITGLWMAE
jgi:2Fe-2S ferredoxin